MCWLKQESGPGIPSLKTERDQYLSKPVPTPEAGWRRCSRRKRAFLCVCSDSILREERRQTIIGLENTH